MGDVKVFVEVHFLDVLPIPKSLLIKKKKKDFTYKKGTEIN